MDGQVLYFPSGKDMVVTARYPAISDGTGAHSEFYYKDNRYVPDDDPTVQVYSAPVDPDPDNVGATMSVFNIPGEDTETTGAFWWRVDIIDSADTRRFVEAGTVLVEAVLWPRRVPPE